MRPEEISHQMPSLIGTQHAPPLQFERQYEFLVLHVVPGEGLGSALTPT